MTERTVLQTVSMVKDVGDYAFERTITIAKEINSDGDYTVRVIDVKIAIEMKSQLGAGSGAGTGAYSRSWPKVWGFRTLEEAKCEAENIRAESRLDGFEPLPNA